MADRNEKRAHPRVDADIAVSVELPDGRTHKTARIRNISQGGVFIEIEERLPFGSTIGLEFVVPGTPVKIQCKGSVIWSTTDQLKQPAGKRGMGVRLMEISYRDMQALARLIDAAGGGN